MRVISKYSDDPTVISGLPHSSLNPFLRRVRPRLVQLSRCGFRTSKNTVISHAWPATGLGSELKQLHHHGHLDLVHLHWLGNNTLSIEEIGRLSMPLVWTLHDQWAFCGAEHYTGPPLPGEPASSYERFTESYKPSSRPAHEHGPDLNRFTWLRKFRSWRRSGRNPIHIVCPSYWLADCARRSSLMGDWPIRVIPYAIDLNVWAPVNKAQARKLLGLPPDSLLVLFGAIGGTTDPRKGADLLLEALKLISYQAAGSHLEQLELVVFGQGFSVHPTNFGFPIHYSGHLHDDISIRLFYAAADVMVVPSRQEAFGQTASEAHACGTPVVCFRTGGLIDIVDDRISGALAEPFDPLSLADAIRWVLEDSTRMRNLGVNARLRAEKLWSQSRISNTYHDLYGSLLDLRIKCI